MHRKKSKQSLSASMRILEVYKSKSEPYLQPAQTDKSRKGYANGKVNYCAVLPYLAEIEDFSYNEI